MKLRIEVPVLLYTDIEVPDDSVNTEDKDWQTKGAWRPIVDAKLTEALGHIGDEDDRGALDHPRLHNASIYLTDHLFPVDMAQSLSIADIV